MVPSVKDQLIIELKDSLNEQREMNKTLRISLDNSNGQVSELTIQIKLLNEQLEYMKKKLFGTSSEKHHPQSDGQLSLFDEAEKESISINEPEEILVKSHVRKSKKTLDEKIKDLPVEQVRVTLNEADQVCTVCGSKMEVIGSEVVRREVEFIPASLKVIEYVSLHYGCPECKLSELPHIVHASVLPALMKHSYASPSTVAWVIYQKYVNGLPLYRQEKDWMQYGFELTRTTMANWIIYCTEHYLKPVYDYCHSLLLARQFAMADETPVQVLKEEGRTPTQKSYMWVFRNGEDGQKPIILYKYAPSRSGDIASEFLKGFTGYLMVDGYTGYNKVKDIRRCCCYAHIRRYFLDAIPKGKEYDISHPAVQGVEYCNKLFKYEENFKKKGYSYEQVKNGRLKHEKPIIEAFLCWLEEQNPIRNSKLDTAVTYALNRKHLMMTYLEDGRCSLSNNLSEQKMKSFVIGRKGWLFCDTAAGAEASSIAYSMVEMALANKLNVFSYIKYLLEKRPNEQMDAIQLEKLLPWSEEVTALCKVQK